MCSQYVAKQVFKDVLQVREFNILEGRRSGKQIVK